MKKTVAFLLLAALWATALQIALAYITDKTGFGIPLRAWTFSAVLFLFFCVMRANNFPHKGFYFVFSLLVSIYAAFLSLLCVYCLKTGHPLSREAMGAVLQTHHAEALDFFFDSFVNSTYVPATLAAFALTMITAGICPRLPRLSISAKPLRYGVTAVLCALVLFLPTRFRVVSVFLDYKRAYAREMLVLEDLARQMRQSPLPHAEKTERGEVYVIVIGESAGRDYMQVYGNLSPNTPWMSAMEHDAGWVRLKNAYSCHVNTVPALLAALEQGNCYTSLSYPHAQTLISLSRAAGMHTAWLSNQTRYAPFGTPITAIAEMADQTVFTNHGIGGVSESYSDEALLPEIENALANRKDNTLLLVHIVGSHSPYAKRIPPGMPRLDLPPEERARYADPDELASRVDYDTSLLVTDRFLGAVHEKLRALPADTPVVFIYFSDHGEYPRKGYGHNADRFTWSMARIPAVIWCSPAYRRRYPEKFQKLGSNENAIWTNDLLFDLYMGLANISFEGKNGKYDISGPLYKPDANTMTTLYGKIKIADDPGITSPKR